jgi:hypothetical protein
MVLAAKQIDCHLTENNVEYAPFCFLTIHDLGCLTDDRVVADLFANNAFDFEVCVSLSLRDLISAYQKKSLWKVFSQTP